MKGAEVKEKFPFATRLVDDAPIARDDPRSDMKSAMRRPALNCTISGKISDSVYILLVEPVCINKLCGYHFVLLIYFSGTH